MSGQPTIAMSGKPSATGRHLRRHLLQATALLALMGLGLPGAALAEGEEGTDHTPIRVEGHPDPEGLLPAQTVPVAVSAIGSAFIAKQAPTLNAFQLVNLLPGANVAMSDPYGLSTSNSLTLRGLTQDEIGVLMEGAPQNDIGYYDAYPSQFADAENLRSVALAPGAVDLDAPVVNGAGGLLSLSLDDPHRRMGLAATISAGSYNMRRFFVRLDTGEIGNSGIAAFVSYSNTYADNWRGAGYDVRRHIDGKITKHWGEGNSAAIAVSFNDARNSTYPNPTLADWQAYGRGYNYDATYTAGDTAYWRLYRQPFRNTYLSAPLHLQLGEGAAFDSTFYFQRGYGNSPYGTQLDSTGNYLGTEALGAISLPGGASSATVLGNWLGDQLRTGDVSKLTVTLGAHRLTAGLWFDYGTDRDVESFTALDGNGNPLDAWGYDANAIHTADGRLLAIENIRTTTVVKGFFLADHIALTGRLGADIGFKGVDVLHNGHNYLPGDQSAVHTDSFAALPRAALSWRASDAHQFFANLSTHFRAPDEYTLYDGYDGYGDVTQRGTTALKNEYAISEELGWRYTGAVLSASLTAFHYHFRNRQLATLADVDGALINTTMNGGAQTSYGLDGEIDWRPIAGLSFYASGEWLHARLDDNLPVDGDYLPTRGKQAVSSPAVQAALGGTYDRGRLFGSFALKYVGKQYATFMNDEHIAAYATLDLSVGVHLAGHGTGEAPHTDLRLNFLNVTNPHVLSGVAGLSTNARDTTGLNGTVIAGSAPTYYIGGGAAVVASLSRQF